MPERNELLLEEKKAAIIASIEKNGYKPVLARYGPHFQVMINWIRSVKSSAERDAAFLASEFRGLNVAILVFAMEQVLEVMPESGIKELYQVTHEYWTSNRKRLMGE